MAFEQQKHVIRWDNSSGARSFAEHPKLESLKTGSANYGHKIFNAAIRFKKIV